MAVAVGGVGGGYWQSRAEGHLPRPLPCQLPVRIGRYWPVAQRFCRGGKILFYGLQSRRSGVAMPSRRSARTLNALFVLQASLAVAILAGDVARRLKVVVVDNWADMKTKWGQ
jgi:hypothetical protein